MVPSNSLGGSNLHVWQLLSNWKWTERAEPAVDLALAQSKMGVHVVFICGRPRGQKKTDVDYHARQKGLSSIYVLEMPKHFRALSALRDYRKLKELLTELKPDVLHSNMRNAHMMTALLKRAPGRPLIINSCYNPEGPRNDLRSRFLYRFCTDGLVVIGEKAKRKALERRCFSSATVLVAEPGVDLDRFSPDRKLSMNRKSFGLHKGHFVLGMVTRIRESRRLDIVLAAMYALAKEFPQLRLLLVGRGRKGAVESLVERPTQAMRISDRIVLPGYCDEDRLVAAYHSMDVLAYPMPGTDKSCRTVREAMAAGLPVIAPRIGFLPELIEDHVTGRLTTENGGELTGILKDFIQNKAKLHEMGHRALETSRQRFDPGLQAQKILSFYHKLLKDLNV